jgi:hypothetical protein
VWGMGGFRSVAGGYGSEAEGGRGAMRPRGAHGPVNKVQGRTRGKTHKGRDTQLPVVLGLNLC